MAKFDINLFTVVDKKLLYGRTFANQIPGAVRFYRRMKSISSSKDGYVPKNRVKLFNIPKHLNAPRGATKMGKPLTYDKGGRFKLGREDRIIGGNSKRNLYGFRNDRYAGKVVVGELNGTAGWLKNLKFAIHQVKIQSENFRVLLGHRAKTYFENTFISKKWDGKPWARLSSYTLRKRAARYRGSGILNEYGDLKSSIKIEDKHSYRGTSITRLHTAVVPANPQHHKKHSLCYAGWHNEGEGTYGRGFGGRAPKHYIQRQFMGHSLKLLKEFASLEQLYLFDSVFTISLRR